MVRASFGTMAERGRPQRSNEALRVVPKIICSLSLVVF